MRISDYDAVAALWHTISGFAIRSLDDSEEGVAKFLKRKLDLLPKNIGHIYDNTGKDTEKMTEEVKLDDYEIL